MPSSSLFEDFSNIAVSPRPPAAEPASELPSGPTNAGFEDGYNEGWTDAQAATKDEAATLNADVAAALQEAGFAYFEARQHIFASMRPLLEAMVEQVVPAAAKLSLAQLVVDELEKIADQTEPPMQIHCAAETEPQLRAVLSQYVNFPVELRCEETLTETQAVLRFADGATHIDLSALVEQMQTCVADFYNLNQPEDKIHA